MKLLYFINQITNSGGIERIVIDKINFLVDEGFDVSLSYFGLSTDIPFYQIDGRVKLIPLTNYSHSHSFIDRLRHLKSIYKSLVSTIDILSPDIIVNVNVPIVSWILPFVRRSIPKLVELHFSYDGLQLMNKELYGRNWIKLTVNNLLRKFIYPKYDKCVVLTNDDKIKWGFKNIEVMSNFSNLKIDDNNVTARLCEAINVGRLEEQKDQITLIEAWSIVSKKYPSWKLKIFGNGSLKIHLQDRINELNLHNHVFLCGVSDDIASHYKKSSFFVLSSKYEGQPLVLIEAMQCGLPCVSFSITGTKEIIENGVNGFIVDSHNPDNLADGIIKMIEVIDNFDYYSNNAILSSKIFSKDVIMGKWINLFYGLVNKN